MFYDNLKAVCDAQGVKITPIVSECGGAKGSISNWKKGAMPNTDIVAKLAVRLNVSADTLIFGKPFSSSGELDEIEQMLLEDYRALSEQGQNYIRQQMFMAKEVYKKPDILESDLKVG
jgi:transcriptional regulator with XRE-family HTH domain